MRLLDLVGKQRYRSGESKSYSLGVVHKTSYAPDGSRLDKPMSKTHMDHIMNRRTDNLHRLKRNMGAYGA